MTGKKKSSGIGDGITREEFGILGKNDLYNTSSKKDDFSPKKSEA